MRSNAASTTRNSDRIADRIHFRLQLCQRRTNVNVVLVDGGPLAVTCNFHSTRQILPLLAAISNEGCPQGVEVDIWVDHGTMIGVAPEPLGRCICAWHCNPIYVGGVERPPAFLQPS